MSGSTSPCWGCANAVPDPASGAGCSWSADGEPVDGWDAEPVYIRNVTRANGTDYRYRTPSYRIRSCPAYRPG